MSSLQIYPEYGFEAQFAADQVHKAFEMDAQNSTQPLTSPEQSINLREEIAHKTSSLAYVKGATVLRMIANLMGQNNFDTAVREYLTEK